MDDKTHELIDFIKDITISGMKLKQTSQVDGLIERYMKRGVKLFSIPEVTQSNCQQLDAELFTAIRKWEQACIDFGLDKDTIETKLIDTIDEATKDIDLSR